MSRGQGATETQSTKVEQKSLKKTLDKYPYLWYNTSTRGEENKVACERVGAEVKWHGEESNPFCPILGADKGSISPNQAKRK